MNFRRQLLCTLLGIHSLLAPLAANAQSTYATKPVRLVNNWPPGGPSDILARSVQPYLQELLKQPVIVDNKAGAAGNLGATEVARAPADGHTVLFGIDTTFTVNPHIYKTMPFKGADLKPVVIMASSGLLVGVHPSTGIKSMKDLVAAGKGKGLVFGSGGNGSPGHLWVEMFKDAADVKVTHVPYRGNTPAVTAVLAGEVNGGALATPGMLPHVQGGKITPLAVTGQQRSKLAPDLPTVGELGLPELVQEVLYLVMVPAATPEPVVQTLQKGIVDALKRPDVQARLTSLDLHFEGQTGSAAIKRLADTSARYAKVVAATGMQVD